MSKNEAEVIEIFKNSGALLEGHFILRSGLRSGHYFQCARVGEDMGKISRLAELLVEQLSGVDCDTVVAPAMGGLVIGQEVARQMGKRFIFLEKVDDKLALRRGFKFRPGEKILVIEDVITKGGRAQETIDIVKEYGGEPVALGMLVDRSQGQARFEVPHYSLFEMSFPVYEVDKLPKELEAIPAVKPGS